MDSDAAHRTKESNPSDDNSLDVTLLPKNISDYMLFRPNADFIAEWNHDRNEVPELLVSHGVTLELWQKWFDQMEIFWKDRIENVVSKILPTRCEHAWLLIPFPCLLFSFILRSVPSWEKTISDIYEYIILFSPLIYLLCCVIHILKINHILVFEISKTEKEVEKAWKDFVSDLNAGKCQQLGLHVKILRYHLDMIAGWNKFYVPFGIQFSSLSEGNLTNVGYQRFQCNEKAMMGNNLSKTLTTRPWTSFRVVPQNVVNNSYFVPGRNFKVEFEHERHEVPSFLQHHGITLHLWQSWFDKMHDLWAKHKYIEISLPVEYGLFSMFSFFALLLSFTTSRYYVALSCWNVFIFSSSFVILVIFFLPVYLYFHERFIEVSWMRFVSDLRENECKKHGLSIESIQYELLFKVPSESDGDEMMERTITVGLQFSKAPNKDLYNQEGEIGQLNFDTCSNSEASSNML